MTPYNLFLCTDSQSHSSSNLLWYYTSPLCVSFPSETSVLMIVARSCHIPPLDMVCCGLGELQAHSAVAPQIEQLNLPWDWPSLFPCKQKNTYQRNTQIHNICSVGRNLVEIRLLSLITVNLNVNQRQMLYTQQAKEYCYMWYCNNRLISMCNLPGSGTLI